MPKQDDRLEGAKAAARKVLANLPRAIESLETDVPGVEAMGISVQSAEQMALGFRDIVQSLEAGPPPMGRNLVEEADSFELIESVEGAAASIRSFVTSLEAAGSDYLDEDVAFNFGKKLGAAELLVESMEIATAKK